jgi:hypothetical protein
MKFEDLSIRSGGSFIKIKEGESIRGVCRGTAYRYDMHWPTGAKTSTLCSGADCELCKAGDKKRKRFKVNFIVLENGVYVAKVLENGNELWEQLVALSASGYVMDKTMIAITRKGIGKESRYTALPVPNGTLAPDKEALVSQVPLNEIAPKLGDKTKTDTETEKTVGDEIPF